MPKQLLIYESAVPLTSGRHGDVSLEAKGGYGFSAGVTAVPLMAAEFVRAASEYPIVFGGGDDAVPLAVLGLQAGQNLYLAGDATWRARYVPAFIRRHPFVFAASDDAQTLTLCVDEAHPGINREGRGQRLFGDDGKPSTFTQGVLEFLQKYQAHHELTQRFGRTLQALDLLVPMQATLTTPQGEKITLGSFRVVSREKLRALDGEALARLAQTDELELVYLHLSSMRNFDTVKDRLIATRQPQAAAESAPAAAAAGTAASP